MVQEIRCRDSARIMDSETCSPKVKNDIVDTSFQPAAAGNLGTQVPAADGKPDYRAETIITHALMHLMKFLTGKQKCRGATKCMHKIINKEQIGNKNSVEILTGGYIQID